MEENRPNIDTNISIAPENDNITDNAGSSIPKESSTDSVKKSEVSISKKKHWANRLKYLIPIIIFSGVLISANFLLSPLKNLVEQYLRMFGGNSVTAYFAFWGISVAFCSIMPGGGTLPTIIAGAIFSPIYVGWSLSWTSANVGSAINLVHVRFGCKPLIQKACKPCIRRSGIDLLNSKYVDMLRKHPLAIVSLSRLPFIGMCMMNYIYSLSPVPAKWYLLGNLVGLFPGSLLWTALGSTGMELMDIISGKTDDPGAIAIAVIEIVVVVLCIIVLVIFSRKYSKRKYNTDIVEKNEVVLKEI